VPDRLKANICAWGSIVFFTVCNARTRSKVPQDVQLTSRRLTNETSICYAHPGPMETASSRRKVVSASQHMQCTPCDTTKAAPAGVKGAGQGQGPGRRPGTEARADARAPGDTRGPGPGHRGHPRATQGHMGLHANESGCQITPSTRVAYLPSSKARSGQTTINVIRWAHVTTTPYWTPIWVPT